MLNLTELWVIIATAAVTACASVLFLRPKTAPPRLEGGEGSEALALLFKNGVLHHATDRAIHVLALFPGVHVWRDLHDILLPRFPGFPETPSAGYTGSRVISPKKRDVPGQIQLSWRGEHCWVRLDPEVVVHRAATDPHHATDTAVLRHGAETMPNPMWEQDETGRVTWYNRAYESVYSEMRQAEPHPERPLFVVQDKASGSRHSARNPRSGDVEWYDVIPSATEGRTLFHATSVTQLVQAENAQRNFVQTLSKTFAHLSIGLAIFDRNGQLILFNPALLDLTELPAEFLSSKPSLLSFLDRLRENRRMPEPKDYRTWRQQIARLVTAAADGDYREIWSLEDGRTYSVQGRPHPEGATAFLIEDISAEISLTRHFRAEQEMTQNLIDKIEEGIAVFSPSGVLTFCNATYRDQWGQNPDAAFADVTVFDCIDLWKGAEDDTSWKQLAAIVRGHETLDQFERDVTLGSGKTLSCRAERMGQGSTVIRFRQAEAHNAVVG